MRRIFALTLAGVAAMALSGCVAESGYVYSQAYPGTYYEDGVYPGGYYEEPVYERPVYTRGAVVAVGSDYRHGPRVSARRWSRNRAYHYDRYGRRLYRDGYYRR